MKIVYIAHPIGGDVDENIAKVLRIVREINLHSNTVVPFAPYIVDCLALDDDIPEQRERGIMNNAVLFDKGFIDELWLFGDRISTGMRIEIDAAMHLGIKVVPRTAETREALESHDMIYEADQKIVDKILQANGIED
ncbi:MAG: DUF4406 domain-containing protein [Bacteroidales bacterium]